MSANLNLTHRWCSVDRCQTGHGLFFLLSLQAILQPVIHTSSSFNTVSDLTSALSVIDPCSVQWFLLLHLINVISVKICKYKYYIKCFNPLKIQRPCLWATLGYFYKKWNGKRFSCKHISWTWLNFFLSLCQDPDGSCQDWKCWL